jgi:dolichol-phosphate mannosyltransferase
MATQRSKGAAGHSILASVIVPAYKEGANLRELVTRVFAAFDKQPAGALQRNNVEMIVVDDNSRDGSEDTIKALAAEGYECRIIVRTTERGLSSAVIRGFQEGRGQLLLCMDADLQHPPESVPSLFAALNHGDTEFVIGTRYGKGVAIDDNWPMHRRVISKGARMLGAALTPLSDPMTGFFGLRKEVVLDFHIFFFRCALC